MADPVEDCLNVLQGEKFWVTLASSQEPRLHAVETWRLLMGSSQKLQYWAAEHKLGKNFGASRIRTHDLLNDPQSQLPALSNLYAEFMKLESEVEGLFRKKTSAASLAEWMDNVRISERLHKLNAALEALGVFLEELTSRVPTYPDSKGKDVERLPLIKSMYDCCLGCLNALVPAVARTELGGEPLDDQISKTVVQLNIWADRVFEDPLPLDDWDSESNASIAQREGRIYIVKQLGQILVILDLIMRLANAKEQPNNFGLSRYLHLKTALLERPDVIDTGFEPFIFESVHKFVVAAGKVDPSTVEAFWKKKEKKAAEVVRCLCEELEMAVEDLFGSHQFIPTLKKNNFDPFKRLRNSRILRPETLYVGLVDPEIRRLRSCGGRPGSAYEESVGKLQVLATKLTDLRMSLRNSKEDMDQAGKEFNEIHLRYIDEAIKRIKNALDLTSPRGMTFTGVERTGHDSGIGISSQGNLTKFAMPTEPGPSGSGYSKSTTPNPQTSKIKLPELVITTEKITTEKMVERFLLAVEGLTSEKLGVNCTDEKQNLRKPDLRPPSYARTVR